MKLLQRSPLNLSSVSLSLGKTLGVKLPLLFHPPKTSAETDALGFFEASFLGAGARAAGASSSDSYSLSIVF